MSLSYVHILIKNSLDCLHFLIKMRACIKLKIKDMTATLPIMETMMLVAAAVQINVWSDCNFITWDAL